MTLTWDQFLIYFEDALAKNDRGAFAEALESWDVALSVRENPYARWNRGQALLSLGRYQEGFRDFESRWRLWQVVNTGCEAHHRLPLWRGEDVRGKRLVVMGEAGFGDVIQMSRYVPALRSAGVDVRLAVPEALHRLLSQLAPIDDDGDVCTPVFDLMVHLHQTIDAVPGAPYLSVDPELRRSWYDRLAFRRGEFTCGIAWAWRDDVGHHRDFDRAIPLERFVSLLDISDAQLVSLQPNDREMARKLGVVTPDYEDFADVAAVASMMDVIVSVDVAAAHVAGAIGHPNTFVMLPWLSSWRWMGPNNVWYPHVTRCQQAEPGDWASAFEKIKLKYRDAA